MITEVMIVSVVSIVFSIGFWIRIILDQDFKETWKDRLIVLFSAIILIAFPLSKVAYDALLCNEDRLIPFLLTLAPVFLAGFTARFEINKLLKV